MAGIEDVRDELRVWREEFRADLRGLVEKQEEMATELSALRAVVEEGNRHRDGSVETLFDLVRGHSDRLNRIETAMVVRSDHDTVRTDIAALKTKIGMLVVAVGALSAAVGGSAGAIVQAILKGF